MTDDQQFVAAVSATLVPAFAVLVGILLNNARLNDLNTRLNDLNTRIAELAGICVIVSITWRNSSTRV